MQAGYRQKPKSQALKPSARRVSEQLQALADERYALTQQRFFKTAPGEYAAGDRFIGVRVPQLRELARRHAELGETQILKLLRSPIHESRMLALLILTERFGRADAAQQTRIYNLYLKHRRYVNNWDLVDVSAPRIAGCYLYDKEREPLYRLSRSRVLWNRRIAVVASLYFIRQNDFSFTLRIARDYLGDSEELIHKATGWMLREVAKRAPALVERFIRLHYADIPRTTLRYAIENFPETVRKDYLRGEIP